MKGARIRYSDKELAFVEANARLSRLDLHRAFVARFGRTDITFDHLKSLCSRRGWSNGKNRPWTVEDETLLRTLYPDFKTSAIAQQLGRSLTSTYGHAKKLGLAKSEAYLASPDACRFRRGDNVGAAYRFKKGQTPANKGKRRPFNANSAKGYFKKGQLPHNTKYLGHERVTKDGYVEISIAETNPHTGFERRYVQKHRYLWEQLHGPVPKGMALKSVDGNRQNTDPSNWILVKRGLLPRLNGKHGRDYDRAPAAIKPAILAIAQLEQAVREKAS